MKTDFLDGFKPQDLSTSFNYQFCFLGLKGIYLNSQYNFGLLCANKQLVEFLITKAIEAVIKYKGLEFDPSFETIGYQYKLINKQPSLLIRLPEKEFIECECNYVLLTEDKNGNKIIFTSEYYAWDKEFKLCKVHKDGRSSFDFITNTKEEFIEAVSKVL